MVRDRRRGPYHASTSAGRPFERAPLAHGDDGGTLVAAGRLAAGRPTVEPPEPMMNRASSLLEKLARHRAESLSDLAAKAIRFTRQSTRAALDLRSCDEVGVSVRCTGRVIVRNHGRIVIGNDVRFNSPWTPIELATASGGELRIGSDVDINYGALISANKRVTIGSHVMIGNHCIIADTEHPGMPDGDSSEPPRPVELGDRVWLAVRVTVLPGAKIGAGAVITAGSVVAGEIPPGVVAGGIPARILRSAAGGADKAPEGRPPKATNGVSAHAWVSAAPQPEPRRVTHRGVLVSDFTIDELARQMSGLPGPVGVLGAVAPFGQVVQTMMQEPDPQSSAFAVVWTRPEAVVPSFARVRAFEPVALDVVLAEVDQFCELVVRGTSKYRFGFVPTWTVPYYDRGLGLLDGRDGGTSRVLAAMNARLMENLAKSASTYALDAQRWVLGAGKNACSPKLWYLGKMPFSPEVFAEAARDIHAAVLALAGEARKLLVLDLDDTMWGGIVGDVGWENLRLGGHDGLGEAFVDFQRGVKNLTRRGIVLAVVSKNEEATALEAIKKHPEMILREEDFVAYRINWRDKAQNILEIAKELNLGLQSVVFIDDNPVERARVREALPEVFVPEWPEDKHLYRSALGSLRCFDTPSISKEDQERTTLYAAERQREKLQASVGSMEEWLKSLGIKVTGEPLGAANLARTVQLLNKTNQLNLSTRRLTEAEILEWAARPGRTLWAVSVSDRFGDAGLTGIVSVELSGTRAEIVDFVLSCRVMGRKVEETLVHIAVEHARAHGAGRVEAHFRATEKNKPCLSFWQASGFSRDDGERFVWDASKAYELPEAVRLELRS